MSGEFPVIKSTHSLVAKHVTKERWDKVKDVKTKTCDFTIAKAIACAVEFDNQVWISLQYILPISFTSALWHLCW